MNGGHGQTKWLHDSNYCGALDHASLLLSSVLHILYVCVCECACGFLYL